MSKPTNALQHDAPWNDANAWPYVRIESVTKKFGDFAAVSNVSLDIYQAEVFCLLGGSGCVDQAGSRIRW